MRQRSSECMGSGKSLATVCSSIANCDIRRTAKAFVLPATGIGVASPGYKPDRARRVLQSRAQNRAPRSQKLAEIRTFGGTPLDDAHTVGLIVVLAVVGALVLRVMTPDERARSMHNALDAVRQLKAASIRRRGECAPFQAALRGRTPRAIVTPALVAANVALFATMLFGGAFAAPDALITWGGNFAPRTTNGEWWRLATSLFVHVGLFHVVINAFALVQIGTLLERLAGRA